MSLAHVLLGKSWNSLIRLEKTQDKEVTTVTQMKLSHFPKGGSICDDLASLWKQSKDTNWNNPYNARSHSIMRVERFQIPLVLHRYLWGFWEEVSCVLIQNPSTFFCHSLVWFPLLKTREEELSDPQANPPLTLAANIQFSRAGVCASVNTVPRLLQRAAQCLAHGCA